ncbi:unnamed protein product [Polarella glacialis]|uniref:Kinesin motor domain-containing protein n=2 Tax=Polarella glacialis TaxID=89957 RepID=A0A813LCB2_POLGL|nr:unnamed protein product [Polarella glacialis]
MQGAKDNPGIYMRTFNELFKVAKERSGWKIQLTGACLEIYNEEIIDLLVREKKAKLQVRQGKTGNEVPGLTVKQGAYTLRCKALLLWRVFRLPALEYDMTGDLEVFLGSKPRNWMAFPSCKWLNLLGPGPPAEVWLREDPRVEPAHVGSKAPGRWTGTFAQEPAAKICECVRQGLGWNCSHRILAHLGISQDASSHMAQKQRADTKERSWDAKSLILGGRMMFMTSQNLALPHLSNQHACNFPALFSSAASTNVAEVQIYGTMTNPEGKQFTSCITLVRSSPLQSSDGWSSQRVFVSLLCGYSLVDLAGSERIAKSGVTGDRAKEAIAINKSLSALGDVINSRATKNSHTPYRNSTLTHLLQDSLGGDSKTLMLMQLNPCATHVEESMCSLQFGARVNAVEMVKK